MGQNRRLLVSWLTLIGGVGGYVLGELFLGRGKGIYVAPLSMLVGLVLAWALWTTRPRVGVAREAEPEVEVVEPRQPTRRAGKVRVTKSQQGGQER